MKYDDTTAAKARYGEVVGKIWGGLDVLCEESEADYSGSCKVLFKRSHPERWVFYEWSYGSCSGCDEWESEDLAEDEIMAEMLKTAAVFRDRASVDAWARSLPAREWGDMVRAALGISS